MHLHNFMLKWCRVHCWALIMHLDVRRLQRMLSNIHFMLCTAGKGIIMPWNNCASCYLLIVQRSVCEVAVAALALLNGLT